MEAARRTQILKGEVGIRERKPTMTLRQFANTSFMANVKATFAAKPKTYGFLLRDSTLNMTLRSVDFPKQPASDCLMCNRDRRRNILENKTRMADRLAGVCQLRRT
jgi:hypothetical protein